MTNRYFDRAAGVQRDSPSENLPRQRDASEPDDELEPVVPDSAWPRAPAGLVVEEEEARLVYEYAPSEPPIAEPPAAKPTAADPSTAEVAAAEPKPRASGRPGRYRCAVRRRLYNAGAEPVTRFLIRISVDRYPGEPERSNAHHHAHPLTWAELGLAATCDGRPMAWQVKQDRNATKEVWLLFENDGSRFPLLPGGRATIEYSYAVGDQRWGNWFQRAVRLPTGRISVSLDFPDELRPVVWGVESSLTAPAAALPSSIEERRAGGRSVFTWSTQDPPLSSRFRFEWSLRVPPAQGSTVAQASPIAAPAAVPGPLAAPAVPRDYSATPAASRDYSAAPRECSAAPAVPREQIRPGELMRSAGIVQRGAPMLDRAARWFDLPEQASLAEDVAARLLEALARVSQLYEFRDGVGLTAPQLGVNWAAAVIRPAGAAGVAPIVLFNPRIAGNSAEQDEQYERCLSFFDVQGRVARALSLDVEHTKLDGTRTVTTFRHATARLVAHGVDHLLGILYTDRMRPGAVLEPAEHPRPAPPPAGGPG